MNECDHVIGKNEDRYEIRLSSLGTLDQYGEKLAYNHKFCPDCGIRNIDYETLNSAIDYMGNIKQG